MRAGEGGNTALSTGTTMSVADVNVLAGPASRTARPPLLSVRGVKTYYGNIAALKGVDLDIHEGEKLDAGAFKALVRAAVALNASGGKARPRRAK